MVVSAASSIYQSSSFRPNKTSGTGNESLSGDWIEYPDDLVSICQVSSPRARHYWRIGVSDEADAFCDHWYVHGDKGRTHDSINYGTSDYIWSKEDAFFDTQGWLDSDSEDDFVSVNGDLTPYRLSSPNYQIDANRTPQRNKELSSPTAPESTSDPCPDAKRKLATLLQEEHVEVVAMQNASGGSEISGKPDSYEVNEPLVPQLNHQTSFITGNENPIEDLKQQKDKKMKTNRCCLPSLVCSLGFKERRKQKMSIVH